MKEHWWRSWHGAPTDPKWLAIARRAGVAPGIVSAVAWALFDYASQNVTRGNACNFDVEAYSAFSGFDLLDIQKVVNAMGDYGLIQDGHLTAWERRQPKREDNSTDRVRAYRERQSSNATKRNETQCDARGEERRGDKKESSSTENVSCETSGHAPVESPNGLPTKYGFEGNVIRLTEKDFKQWQRAYSRLDLLAELTARDAWLSADASAVDRKRWFISTSKYLANRNAEAKAKAVTDNGRHGPNDPLAGIL